ncbi:MAG: hypothetical protein R3F60_29260 [bacterium]
MSMSRLGMVFGSLALLAGCNDGASTKAPVESAARPLVGQVDLQAFAGMSTVRAIDAQGGFVDGVIGADGKFSVPLQDGQSYLLVLLDANGDFGPDVLFERNRQGDLTRSFHTGRSLTGEATIDVGQVIAGADAARVEISPLAVVDSDEDGQADIDDDDDDDDGIVDDDDGDMDGDGVDEADAEEHVARGRREHGGNDDGDAEDGDDDDHGAAGEGDDDDDDGDAEDDDGDDDEGGRG